MSLVSLATVLIPGALLFGGLRLGSPGAWFTLIWVLLLGLVATMPIGAVLGSLFSNPSSLGFVFVPMMGLIAISGIFYPITAFPVMVAVDRPGVSHLLDGARDALGVSP